MSLAATLPDELLYKILIAGTTDEIYGRSFAAKCMLLARWIQGTIAPILYDVVKMDSESRMESFLFALENDDKGHRSYRVREIVRCFIIADDEDNARDVKFWSSAIWKVTQALDMSVWKELEIPIPLVASTSSGEKAGRTYRLPYSTTLTRYTPLRTINKLDFSTVNRIRIRTTGLAFWRIAGLVDSFATKHPNITHLAVIATTWPEDDDEFKELTEAAENLQAVLVLMMVDDRADAEGEAAESKGRELISVKAPRLAIWVDDYEETYASYNNCYSDPLWREVERELAGRKRNGDDHKE
jgi:hypothetical protein